MTTEITDRTANRNARLYTLLTFVVVGTVIVLGRQLPASAFMWVLAVVLWLSCKTVAWRHATRSIRPTPRAAIEFFIGWPGMDARPFLRPRGAPVYRWRHLLIAMIRIAVGLIIIGYAFFAATDATNPLLVGWIGMIGTMFALHFGLFDVLACFWNARGVEVEPIMDHPFAAGSLTEFWSRWNRGFRDIASLLIFRPLHRIWGASGAMLATFLFSGLIHDLVVSIPAGAGYGWPTVYFMLQGIGMLIDRSIAPGLRGAAILRRVLLYVTAIVPICLLFHPPFVLRVYVPMLVSLRSAMHAIGGLR